MKIFSDEDWQKSGVKTIPVGCPDRFLSKTEKQDVEALRRSQQEWWAMEDRGGHRTMIVDGDIIEPGGDYPHDEYDYSTDDLNDFEYIQDQYV